jgi:nucleoside-diphosphate-sugar epimerase
MLNQITIAITGVTGLLGRNILFEYCKQYKGNLKNLNLILFGRDNNKISFKERVKHILLTDGRFYIDINDQDIFGFIEYFDKEVTFINIDLKQKDLRINCHDYEKLVKIPMDVFYNTAALTSLDNNSFIEKEILETNIQGTEAILNLLIKCKLKRFCHFSSAYSTGSVNNTVSPDDRNMERIFRNPYEY